MWTKELKARRDAIFSSVKVPIESSTGQSTWWMFFGTTDPPQMNDSSSAPPPLLLPLLLLSWQPYAHTQRPWSVLHGPEACLLATLFTCHWDFLACVSYQEAYKSWHTLGRQGCGFLTGPCVSGGTALKPGAITGGSP